MMSQVQDNDCLIQVLVLDDNGGWWQDEVDKFKRQMVELTICPFSKVDQLAQALSQVHVFDLVLLHETLNDGRSGISIIDKLTADREIREPRKPVPAVVIDNYHKDLTAAMKRWADLNQYFDIHNLTPLPVSPELLKNFLYEIQRAGRQRNFGDGGGVGQKSAEKTVVDALPIPARLVSPRHDVLAHNQHWFWSKDYPAPKEVVADRREFFLEQEDKKLQKKPETPEKLEGQQPDPKREHPDTYWILQEQALPNGNLLQIAYQNEVSRAADLKQAAGFLWQLFKEIGFRRMRFYLLREVPHGNDVMSLFSIYGHDEGSEDFEEKLLDAAKDLGVRVWDADSSSVNDLAVKFSFSIDDPIKGNLDKLNTTARQEVKRHRNDRRLVWDNFRSTGARAPKLTRMINKIFNILNPRNVVYIPIFMGGDIKRMVAIAAVDTGSDTPLQDMKAIINRRELAILERMRIFKRRFGQYYRDRRVNARENALEFIGKKENNPSEINPDTQKEYIKNFLHYCLRETKYTRVALAWKATSHSPACVVGTVTVDNAKTGNGQDFKEYSLGFLGKKVVKEKFPALHHAISTGQPKLYHDGNHPDLQGVDSGNPRPRIALPITLFGEVRGALAFSVANSPYKFLQKDIDRLEESIRIITPVIHYMQQVIQSRESETRLQHEMRAALGPAIRSLRKLPDQQAVALPLWYMRDLLDAATTLAFFGPTETSFDLIQVANKEFERAENVAWRFGKIFVEEPSCGSCIITASEGVFRFALRTLFSNALRHSDESDPDADQPIFYKVSCDDGNFMIFIESLGEKVNDEALDLAFDSAAIRTGERDTDGSHTALAQSRISLEQYGATITLKKLQRDGKRYISGQIIWPAPHSEEK